MCAACNCRKAMQNTVNDLSHLFSQVRKSTRFGGGGRGRSTWNPAIWLPYPYMQRTAKSTNVTLKPRRLEWQFPFRVTPPSDIGGGLGRGRPRTPGGPGHTRMLFPGLKTPRHIFPGRLSQTFRSSSAAASSSSFPSRRRRRGRELARRGGIFIRLRRLSDVSAV